MEVLHEQRKRLPTYAYLNIQVGKLMCTSKTLTMPMALNQLYA